MRSIKILALTTFRETMRSKMVYLVLLFSFLTVGASTLFGTVTIGDQVKVIKDFGLTSLSLCTVGYAVIAGSTLLAKELSKKTIFTLLAKPISRSNFIIGKFFGLVASSLLLLFLMGIALFLYAAFFENRVDMLLFQAFYYEALQCILICAVVIFFSSAVATPVLNGLFSFGAFLVGRNAESILQFSELTQSSTAKMVYWVVPHLTLMNRADDIVYGITQPLEHMGYSALYCVGYSICVLTLGVVFFERREFH